MLTKWQVTFFTHTVFRESTLSATQKQYWDSSRKTCSVRLTTENNLDSTSNSICWGKGAAAPAATHSPPAPCNMHEALWKAHEGEEENEKEGEGERERESGALTYNEREALVLSLSPARSEASSGKKARRPEGKKARD